MNLQIVAAVAVGFLTGLWICLAFRKIGWLR